MKLLLLLLLMLTGCSASTKPTRCHLPSRFIADASAPPIPGTALDSESDFGPLYGPLFGGSIGGLVGFSVGAGTGISIAAALTPDFTTTILFACVGAVTGAFSGMAFGAYAFGERMVHSASMFIIQRAFV